MTSHVASDKAGLSFQVIFGNVKSISFGTSDSGNSSSFNEVKVTFSAVQSALLASGINLPFSFSRRPPDHSRVYVGLSS